MPDDLERVFAAIARTEDNLRQEIHDVEKRSSERLADSMTSMRELLSAQGLARDSTLRDAISVIRKENALDLAECSKHRGACATVIKDIEQTAKTNGMRIDVLERWKDGTDREPGADQNVRSILAWRRSYWPKFIVMMSLTVGGLLTFFLTFVDITFK